MPLCPPDRKWEITTVLDPAKSYVADPYAYARDTGMLQAAEQALIQHRHEQSLYNVQIQRDQKLGEIQRAFLHAPSRDAFRNLVPFCNLMTEAGEIFDFMVMVLRPGGLPREGPFTWCSRGEDPTDFADTKDLTMTTHAILTPPGVCSFLNLQRPRAIVVGGELRYSFTLIFDKAAQKRPEFKALQQGIDEALKERWPARLPPGLRSPFHDGVEKEGQYDGYHAGDIFISPWSKDKPGAVNVRKEDILDWTEFYAGWVARANVRPFAYDQGANKGCGLFLDSVQFLRPGPRLDGRKAAAESFPDDEDTEQMI